MAPPTEKHVDKQRSFARAARHSRRVRFLKIGLPVGSVLLVAMFAGWAWLSSPQGFTADVESSALLDGKLVMANPTLNGFTRDNLPYSVTAERAVQDLTDTSRITLENIDARLPIEAENWADITAASGIFNNEDNTLDVDSKMLVSTTEGLRAELASAFVDMAAGAIETDAPVHVSMKGSTLSADSMRIRERGKVVVFEKRVRMTIIPERDDNRGDDDK